MRNLLRIECKRALVNKAFYISLGIGAVLCIWLLGIQIEEVRVFHEIIQKYGIEKAGLYYPRSLYNSFIGLDYAYLPSVILYTIFPLLVTFPHAVSYYRDKKSGYIKNVLIKADRKDYYTAKYLSVFVSGFVTTALILFFSLWISAMFFPALRPEVTTATYCPFDSSAMLVGLYYTEPLLYTLVYILLDAVFLGVIATIAIGISMVAENMLLVYAGGMMLYLIIDYIATLTGLHSFSPLSFLKPTQFSCNAEPEIILMELLVFVLAVAVPFLKTERKKDVF